MRLWHWHLYRMQCSCHTQPPQDMWHKLGPSHTHILMLTVTYPTLYIFPCYCFFAFWRSTSRRECELHFYGLMVNPFFFVPNASWSHQNSVLLAQSCREEWEESWSSVFVFWSFLPCVIRKGSTLRRWISLPVWPFFFFFLNSKRLERICGPHLFQMDVSHQNSEYLTEDSHCMVQWTGPVHHREDCSWVLDWCFWISEHKMAHLHFVDYQCPSNSVLLLFIMSKRASWV